MESNYSNRDFEQYVKKNADEYRMFPSEKVWKGVHNALHTRKRWPGFGLAFLLLLTGGAVTWVMTTYPVSDKRDNSSLAANAVTPKSEKSSAAASEQLEKILSFNQQPDAGSIPTTKESVASESSLSTDPEISKESQITTTDNAGTDAVSIQEPVFIGQESSNSTIINNIDKPAIAALAQPLAKTIPATTTRKNVEEPAAAIKEQSHANNAPLTIESVADAYHYKAPKKKMSWQVFFTPTVSYRRLSTNKSYENSAIAMYPFVSLTDVNKAVTHKPDIGFQLGVSAGYPLAKWFKIRAGIQANVNRYDIKAFAYNGEVATINLNSGAGSSSVSTWTYYRNYGGYKTDWIKNYYLSLSIPIGAEITFFGNKKTSVGVAGTIQPTYIVSDRAYLISTDYKNYAKVPWLIRHVNVSTGFETFVNYQSGKTKWQIGPQVRYQMLSSFQNKYPVKENLFDFGLKVGIILNE